MSSTDQVLKSADRSRTRFPAASLRRTLTNDQQHISSLGPRNPCSVAGQEETQPVTETTVEISAKGEWIRVPALNANGTMLIATGKLPRIASVLDEEWLEQELQDPEACVRLLKKSARHISGADILTFAQKLPATKPKYSYLLEWDSIAAIHITSFQEWWDRLPQVTRKNVRRSQKRGVEVQVRELDDDLIRDIVELTNDSPVRQGKHFVHYGKTFEQTKKDQSTHLGRSDFLCAYSGRELVGLLKVVYGGERASILQFIPKASQQDKRPANALIAKAVEICEAKRISCLIYGLFSYGKKKQSSLVEFKVRNGFEEILVPRFYVPLTMRGSFCLKLNLHGGLIGLLPDSAIRMALNVRTRWYTFKGFLSRCSSVTEQPNRIRQTDGSIPPAGSNEVSEA